MKNVREELITLDGLTYVVRALTYGEKKDIRNMVTEYAETTDPITQEKVSVELFRVGDFQSRTIFCGLKSWSVVDGDKPVLLSWDAFLEHFNRSTKSDSTVEIGGISYLLRPLTYTEKIAAKNQMSRRETRIDPQTKLPETGTVSTTAEYNARMIFSSLKAWSLSDEELNWKSFLEKFPEEHEERLLQEVYTLTPSHDEILFAVIRKLSTFTAEEKKTLFPPSAG